MLRRCVAMTQGRVNNYEESVIRLSQALCNIQFQDVMRQRLEHVQQAMVEMRDHIQYLMERPADSTWTGDLHATFNSLLANHLNQYRMASQTATHLAVYGEKSDSTQNRPSIELF